MIYLIEYFNFINKYKFAGNNIFQIHKINFICYYNFVRKKFSIEILPIFLNE